jgi:hypothetical protein
MEQEEEGGVIQEFFGQLWMIPDSPPPPNLCRRSHGTRVQVGDDPPENLVWIRRELWESKQFGVKDCYPVLEGDSWKNTPKKLGFASNLWAQGERKTFLQALMTGRGRGRGRGARPPHPGEEWAWGQGWPHPHRPPPPPTTFFQQGAPPPPYEYYPNPHFPQSHSPPPPYHLPPISSLGTRGHHHIRGPGQDKINPKAISRANSQHNREEGRRQRKGRNLQALNKCSQKKVSNQQKKGKRRRSSATTLEIQITSAHCAQNLGSALSVKGKITWSASAMNGTNLRKLPNTLGVLIKGWVFSMWKLTQRQT